ncbi:MAG TPA: rod shape-determining protein MreC [Candidatus Eisenbacteria bacterium]|jgi:rod shape-determining protein MreC
MLRSLLTRRPDWTVFTAACALSIVLMLLPGSAQVRVAWFLQHVVLAPVSVGVDAAERGISVYWENQKLRRRVLELRMEVDALRSLRDENVRLTRLLDLRTTAPKDFLAARVVGRSLDRLGGSLTIDRGAEDGLESDAAVVTPDGLVGRVERLALRGARVLTLLHRDCAVAVRLERSRVQGVVQWQYGDQPVLELLYVPSQEDVKPGDRVETSGLGGLFPAGIRVGTVARVGLAENGLMKTVAIRPAVSFERLEQVLVFLPGARGVYPEVAAEPAPADSTAAAPETGSPP